MTLSEMLQMSPFLTIENIEKAYFDIIKKISLPLAFVPVMMDTQYAKWNGFESPALCSGEEIAIKEIVNFKGVKRYNKTFYTNLNVSTASPLRIGVPATAYQGFSKTEIENSNKSDINESRNLVPEIYQEDTLIVCTNYDSFDSESNPYFWMLAYFYPYLVRSETSANTYNITSISPTLTDKYVVDEFLMYPVIAKAISFYYQEELDPIQATAYDNATIQYLNIYNNSLNALYGSAFDKIGNLEAMSL
jgi:hypothetical protein